MKGDDDCQYLADKYQMPESRYIMRGKTRGKEMKIEGFVDQNDLDRWQRGYTTLLCVWKDEAKVPVTVEVGRDAIRCSACGEPAEIVADLDMTKCCHARVAGEEA